MRLQVSSWISVGVTVQSVLQGSLAQLSPPLTDLTVNIFPRSCLISTSDYQLLTLQQEL